MLVSCARAFTFSFARSEVYGGDAKVDVVQCQTALCHAVSCHGTVDAARQHVQCTAAGAHGQTALTRYFRAVDVGTVITNFLRSP